MNPEVKASTAEFCQALTARAQAASKRSCWFEPKPGPWYIKVLLHDGAVGVRDLEPGTFCFVSKDDSPFDWSNYRVGDVMAPKTSRKPWKMDTGAVANVLEPDGGISYRVIRYGKRARPLVRPAGWADDVSTPTVHPRIRTPDPRRARMSRPDQREVTRKH